MCPKKNTLMSMQRHQNWLSDVPRWHREDQIMSTKWKGHQKCGPKCGPNMVQKGDPNLEWSKEWSKTWSKTWSKRGFKEWSKICPKGGQKGDSKSGPKCGPKGGQKGDPKDGDSVCHTPQHFFHTLTCPNVRFTRL